MLDEYSDLLAQELRDLWPLASKIACSTKGRLMGGTALALYLRHRSSTDIDIMTLEAFDGREVKALVEQHLGAEHRKDYWQIQQVLEARNNGYCAMINGVRLDVFRALGSGEAQAADMQWLQDPVDFEGMPVGSVPDILSAKLAAAVDRSKLRDFIDLAAIDLRDGYSLEDGLEFYRRTYGLDKNPNPEAIRRILMTLADPGLTEPDRAFDSQRQDTLDYLRARSGELQDYLAAIFDQRVLPTATDRLENLGAPRPAASPNRCGRWMPRARVHCDLPANHKGPHRRNR